MTPPRTVPVTVRVLVTLIVCQAISVAAHIVSLAADLSR